MRMIKSVLCVALAFMLMGICGTVAAEEPSELEVQFVCMTLQESDSYVRADITIDNDTVLFEFEEQDFPVAFAILKNTMGHYICTNPAVIEYIFDYLGIGIWEDPYGIGIWEDPY